MAIEKFDLTFKAYTGIINVDTGKKLIEKATHFGLVKKKEDEITNRFISLSKASDSAKANSRLVKSEPFEYDENTVSVIFEPKGNSYWIEFLMEKNISLDL